MPPKSKAKAKAKAASKSAASDHVPVGGNTTMSMAGGATAPLGALTPAFDLQLGSSFLNAEEMDQVMEAVPAFKITCVCSGKNCKCPDHPPSTSTSTKGKRQLPSTITGATCGDKAAEEEGNESGAVTSTSTAAAKSKAAAKSAPAGGKGAAPKSAPAGGKGAAPKSAPAGGKAAAPKSAPAGGKAAAPKSGAAKAKPFGAQIQTASRELRVTHSDKAKQRKEKSRSSRAMTDKNKYCASPLLIQHLLLLTPLYLDLIL